MGDAATDTSREIDMADLIDPEVSLPLQCSKNAGKQHCRASSRKRKLRSRSGVKPRSQEKRIKLTSVDDRKIEHINEDVATRAKSNLNEGKAGSGVISIPRPSLLSAPSHGGDPPSSTKGVIFPAAALMKNNPASTSSEQLYVANSGTSVAPEQLVQANLENSFAPKHLDDTNRLTHIVPEDLEDTNLRTHVVQQGLEVHPRRRPPPIPQEPNEAAEEVVSRRSSRAGHPPGRIPLYPEVYGDLTTRASEQTSEHEEEEDTTDEMKEVRQLGRKYRLPIATSGEASSKGALKVNKVLHERRGLQRKIPL